MAKRLYTTPSGDNFFALAEFKNHDQAFLVWPERTDNWRMGAKPIQKLFIKLINELVKSESVTVLVSKKQFLNARSQLPTVVRVIETSTNECFIRDYGPLFLSNKATKTYRGLKSNFNSWGGTTHGVYFPWNDDSLVSYKIFELENLDYYEMPIVLEWSMICLDGNGVCFASEEGILSSFKNPNLSKSTAEMYLKEYLNIKKVVWIPNGLPYDQTKGQIDNILAIINKNQILISWTENGNDPAFSVLEAAYKVLKACTNIEGKKYQIIKMPIPNISERTKAEIEMIDYNFNHNQNYVGQKLTGSYTNFYLTNKSVIMPTFGDLLTEQQALAILTKLFINKKIILFNCRELILGNNGLRSLICPQMKLPFFIHNT